MSLVNTKTLADYDESYLYNQLRSFHESKPDVHYVLTHFVQKKDDNKEASQALSRMQRESRRAQGVEEDVRTPTAPATRRRTEQQTTPPTESVSSSNWDANDWGPNTDTNPQTESVKPEPVAKASRPATTTHVERIPDSWLKGTGTPTTNTENNSVTKPVANNYNNNNEPKTAIATRRRPESENTVPTRTAQSEQDERRRPESENTVSTRTAQSKQDERNVKNTTNNQRVFLNLQKSFETAEWITKSNQMKIATQDALKNMIVDKINIIDLRDNINTDTYIALNNRTMHLLYSVAIGANLDIILIFNDSTTIRLAPESWLRSTNAETLIKNQYFYIYKDLNLNDFQQSLKPLVAEEISTSEYMQMFLKYSPIVTDPDH